MQTFFLREDSKNRSRRGDMATAAIELNDSECALVLEELQRLGSADAHAAVWSRRAYAPMLIHGGRLARVREAIEAQLPQYAIAFDVIFESRGGPVGWHCDYESSGPFEVRDRLRAVQESHFVSVHFNVTNDGGALTVLPWVWLSYAHYLVIACWGIFTRMHTLIVALSSPCFACCATSKTNRRGVGNVFDNTRLHMVTEGRPRVSYVVRLVKRGCVGISVASIERGVGRSAACVAFDALRHIVGSATVDADTVPWARLLDTKLGSEAERVRDARSGRKIRSMSIEPRASPRRHCR